MKSKSKPVPKKLYKRFYVETPSARLGLFTDARTILVGPFSGKGYRDKHGTRLSPTNAKGFVARTLKGPLRMCTHGYHACTSRWFGKSIARMKEEAMANNEVFAEVELTGVTPLMDKYGDQQGQDGKWVGTGMRIVRVWKG